MTDRVVLVTVIMCSTLFALAALSGMVALALTGHDSAAVAALIGTIFGPLLAAIAARLKGMHDAIKSATTTQGGTDGTAQGS